VFVRLYELVQEEKNEELIKFAAYILEVYDKHGMKGHIL
jgi:hypothetical protein